MILTADWHLTDNPADEYRWQVFRELLECCRDSNDGNIFILGDIADRKDHHSGALLNRMLHEFERLSDAGLLIHAIMGNHDYPLKGTPYWSVLNTLAPRVQFHVKPKFLKREGNIWLLPYTPTPDKDWADIDWDKCEMAFIHQPTSGARLENGRKLTDIPDLPIPRGIAIFAGDIHTPQTVGDVQYVGAPHQIDFGDKYLGRFIKVEDGLFDDCYDLGYMRKAMLDLKTLDELNHNYDLQEGDQAKVRMVVDPKRIGQWPADRLVIQEWAKKLGVTLASIEAVVTFTLNRRADIPDIKADLEQVFKAYCEEEGLKGETVEVGLDILRDDTDD